jgi:haloalkane dehalogenase
MNSMTPPDTHWIDRTAYPFDSHFFETDIGRMHYIDEGAGHPLVMLHGNPTWSFLYRTPIKRLSGRYRCIAPDYIGFGLSDKPPGWTYRPRDHAALIRSFIDALGLEEISLFVQDWGGPIGIDYAIDHPERVRSIVVMNSWMWPVRRDPHYLLFSAFFGGPVGRYLIRHHNVFARYAMPAAFGDRFRLPAQIHSHYRRPFQNPETRKGCWVFPRQIVGATPWLDRLWTKRRRLAQIPALIFWGMADKAFREKELDRWRSVFPEAPVVRLADVGHFVPEEAGGRLAEAAGRFLDEILADPSDLT